MNTTQMTDAALAFAAKDLLEVISVQEKTEREFPGSCAKLGQYWDELYAVLGEIKDRKAVL